MAISARLALWEQKIREEEHSPAPTSPPPPFIVIPGGLLKQLVRETEKESKKQREKIVLKDKVEPPEKSEKSLPGPDQQFATEDTEILGRGGDMTDDKGQPVQSPVNGEQQVGEGLAELAKRRSLPFRRGPLQRSTQPAAPRSAEAAYPDVPGTSPEKSAPEASKSSEEPETLRVGLLQRTPLERPGKGKCKGKVQEESRPQPSRRIKGTGKSGGSGGLAGDLAETSQDARRDPEGVRQVEEPAGLGSPAAVEIQKSLEEAEKLPAAGSHEGPVEVADLDKVSGDGWYEAEKVWLARKDTFALATELKPDVGTPELPAGLVRVRVDVDDSVVDVDEEDVQKANPSSLDYAEDLASLVSLNEASVLHVLCQRWKSQLFYTYSGSGLVAIRPFLSVAQGSRKAFQGKRTGMPPHVCAVAQRAFWRMLTQRQDQTIVPLGRSSAGKTTTGQEILEYLVAAAGSAGSPVTVEKIQAMFTVLRAFGGVSSGLNEASTRFSMVMALDFGTTGRVTAAHLQTMLLERARVVQQPAGEGTFNVFTQMLAGLDLDQRSTLHLHQMADSSSFGIQPGLKGEEKQRASAAFSQLQAALGTLGVVAEEQEALWRVLAGIYHLGAAGACRVGRKQFMNFDWASRAADILGCEFEELTTAVFKHHLRRIIEQVTAGASMQHQQDQEGADGPKLTGVECLEGMAAGLYEEVFAAVVMLINRSFSSSQLTVASLMVVDTPGFLSPRHQRQERAATFEEFCHNYGQERLQGLFHRISLEGELDRCREENVEVSFELPDLSPAATVALVDQSPSQMPVSPGGPSEDPKGLLWILDEEALSQGPSDSRALERLCSYFGKERDSHEEPGVVRKCEQALQFEVAHRLGTDPVRYDATGWVNKAKWNLSVQNAVELLQQSKINALRNLFLPRCKVPLVCRSVAGLEGYSQQALQRIGCIRKTFTSSFAAVKKKSVCVQIKLQLDALCNLLKRTQIHFVHCLTPGMPEESPLPPEPAGASATAWDIPSLRVQLSGSQILEALRLYRIGYADHMPLTQFWRRFQVLAQPVMKKFTSAYELTDENKALEELFQALSLEKKSVAVGRTQVFLKAGVLPRLEKQREKLVSQNFILLQAVCKGFLSRQQFKKLKIQRLAARCLQKNLSVFLSVKDWPWWQLMCRLRPLLTVSLAEGQLQSKEDELATLRKKLENSETSRQELRESSELLEAKVLDLTAELSDERLKGDVVCQALESERAERLRATREAKDLQNKHDQLQKRLETAEKQLEELRQQLRIHETSVSSLGTGEEWQMQLDCAQTEIGFLRKRIAQMEERLEKEQQAKAESEQKLGEVQKLYESARRTAQQLKRKCKQLTCDLEDTRVLMENQQSRNHELEKKQKKFDMQLAQALGESAFEKSLREKVTQENSSFQYELGRLQQCVEQREHEKDQLAGQVARLSAQVKQLSSSPGPDANAAAALQKQLWDLESRAAEQQEALHRQSSTTQQLEQLHLRLELEIEGLKQQHRKELEDKEEELEDTRRSCQKRLRQLEMQSEQEVEAKRTVLREKRDLEGLVATLCEQIGHRDFDVEKRLRRDLKRTRALLADVQLLLETSGDGPCPSGSKEEWAKLRSQWEESTARCATALESQKTLTLELENLHSELESVTRNKNLVEEQLYQLQHEKADLLKHIEEDQEDLNELMAKHKVLIAQSATDLAQIQELQLQLEETKKDKQSLQEKLQTVQARVAAMEEAMVQRSIVSRQESVICDLENKMEFQSVQIKRFEGLVLRLRDSVVKVGEELEKAKDSEAREQENANYYRMRMEEIKAEMSELAQRELEACRRRVDLEKQVDELLAVRQTLQADLETSIRRIADLQVALEEVHSSDESETESVQTARESLSSRQETASQLSLGSTLSLNLESEGSVRSWMDAGSGWTSPSAPSLVGSTSRLSVNSSPFRVNKDQENSWQPMSELNAKKRYCGREVGEPDSIKAESPSVGAQRRKYEKSTCKEEADYLAKLGAASLPVIRPTFSPAAPGETFPSRLSPSLSRTSLLEEDKISRSSSALSEYIEELRRKRLKDKDPLDDSASLPIYQTTGASFLRRSRMMKDEEDLPVSLDEYRAHAGADLVRSSSLRSISSDYPVRSSLSPVTNRAPKLGSYDSLVPNTEDAYSKLSSSILLKPRRSCLEPSLEENTDLGKESFIFQSRRLSDIPSEGTQGDPFSWKIPTLSYERRAEADFDDILPAIRKSQSTSNLSRGPKERPRRPLSVHFEDRTNPSYASLPEMKTVLAPNSESKEDPGDLSDSSSSSGSVLSFRSADSVKSRPKAQCEEGEGRVGKGSVEGATDGRRPEAEGKEDDVSSIMMKYLGKE